MEFDLNKPATKKRLEEFAEEIKEISDVIGFKVSARGWCYQLEGKGFITKAEFDKVESLINRCRKLGILPIDFTAEEEGRKFSGVEVPDDDTPIEDLRYWVERTLRTEENYIPDWWEGEEYYIQMVVEKIDLKTHYFHLTKEQYNFVKIFEKVKQFEMDIWRLDMGGEKDWRKSKFGMDLISAYLKAVDLKISNKLNLTEYEENRLYASCHNSRFYGGSY